LWVGTPAALNRIDRKTGQRTYYRRRAGPAATTDVIAIREDRSGNLWVGTYGHGLLRLERRTGQFKTYQHDPADPHTVSSDIIMRLLEDHDGTLWVISSDGLNRFEKTRERFTTYRLDSKRSPFFLELIEDGERALWLGTKSSGLYRFDPATGHLTNYEHDMKRPGTLSDNRVNSVYIDRSGTMWVGTQNGLDKFDRKAGTFTVYTRRDGLSGNAIGCVLEDNHGNLWMSTNNGVSRFDPRSGTARSYSIAEGLPGPDLTGWGGCFTNSSGEMFFGGFSGGAAFFPDKVVDDSYTPPTVLTDFRLWGNSVEIGPRSPLKQSVSSATDITLSHKQNLLSLTFSALSYSNPATNHYRYKLEGLERDWNEAGSDRRQVTYTALPPGRYTFRAQGATSSGSWSEPGAALSIEILAA
jgi:streptogramin lyase